MLSPKDHAARLPVAATRYLFFTGKGGVGKTSLSCATAIAIAESGRRVLIVSTDPASNLDEVLETPLTDRPTAITGVPRLHALNIDPEAAAAAYRERMVAPFRGVLPAAAVRSIEEQFSGGCTVEIAAFDAFAELIGAPARTAEFDHVVFDTAPTGHTLRLLTLPSAWTAYLDTGTSGASCLGPLAGLKAQQHLYGATVGELANAEHTTVVLVARPEESAFREAERTHGELADLGIRNQVLAVNGVFRDAAATDAIAGAMARRHAAAIAAMPPALATMPRSVTPFLAKGLVGLAALHAVLHPDAAPAPPPAAPGPVALPGDLAALIATVEHAGHGLIMTMGKGGVGKTSIAAAFAVVLAQRGHRVLLSTTDPAAHLNWTLAEAVPGLTVGRIDPAQEVARYRDAVLAKAGANLDANGRAMLEEDLRSPCTEEIAVFHAFARVVDSAIDGFVVLDTAPTGHTLLLMDSAEAYHREVLRTRGDMPEAVRQLLPRLRDPDFTRVVIVTLAEATPVHEAERLQADLRRAGIEPFAWVINQSLLASETAHPVLALRGRYEAPFIERVVTHAPRNRVAVIAWLPTPPVGIAGLLQMVEAKSCEAAAASA